MGCMWELTTQQVLSIQNDLISLVNIELLSVFRIFIGNRCYDRGTYFPLYVPRS